MENNMINALLIDPKDNVIVAIRPLKAGDIAYYYKKNGNEVNKVDVKEDIPIYHKMAIKEIKKDEAIIKYGEVIGTAYCDLASGIHVHVHNVKDRRNVLAMEGRR